MAWHIMDPCGTSEDDSFIALKIGSSCNMEGTLLQWTGDSCSAVQKAHNLVAGSVCSLGERGMAGGPVSSGHSKVEQP